MDKFDQRMIDRDEKITGSQFRQKVSLVMYVINRTEAKIMLLKL